MSDRKPDYAPCEVELEFGDGARLFRLPLKMIAELQEKCDAPIGTIYARVAAGHYKGEDLIETVRCGLIGGGMDGPAARKMIDRYCDKWPLEVWWKHAVAILSACIHGHSLPDAGSDAEGGDQKKSPDGSTSPKPSGTAPSSADTDPEKPAP